MSQTYDSDIAASDSISASRTVINDNFDALLTNLSGTSAPSGLSGKALYFWADTTNNILKLRNAGDTAFGNVLDLADDTNNYGLVWADGSTVMDGNLLVNGANDLVVDLGRSGDTNNARVDFDDDGDTSIRASADDTLAIEIGGTDEISISTAAMDLGTGVANYVVDLGRSGDTQNGRIDFDFDNDTSIRASADDTIAIEVGGSDAISITATVLDTAHEIAAGADVGGTASHVTLTNTSSTDVTGTTITLGGDNILGSGAQAGWLKFYDGTTVAWVPYWT